MTDNYTDIQFAKLDMSRQERTGLPETIFCSGKTNEQLLGILQTFQAQNRSVLGTRCSQEQADFIKANKISIHYDKTSKIITLGNPLATVKNSSIAVCCAGTADLPVAEEAAQTLEFFGIKVARHYDVGIAGLHRLLSKIEDIRTCDVVIAVAGMEGALASVVAGLVKSPVIAVPTSVGYGASFSGLSALLAMLNSCAEGVSVVNIDNGFGAAVQAFRIAKLKGENR